MRRDRLQPNPSHLQGLQPYDLGCFIWGEDPVLTLGLPWQTRHVYVAGFVGPAEMEAHQGFVRGPEFGQTASGLALTMLAQEGYMSMMKRVLAILRTCLRHLTGGCTKGPCGLRSCVRLLPLPDLSMGSPAQRRPPQPADAATSHRLRRRGACGADVSDELRRAVICWSISKWMYARKRCSRRLPIPRVLVWAGIRAGVVRSLQLPPK